MENGNWTTASIADQADKIFIVTGANSGLGFETSRALAARGAQVVMACRSMDRGQQARDAIAATVPNAKLDLMALDLSALDSVARFAEAFHGRYSQLNVLINNAGVMAIPYQQTADGFEMQFGTNHLGHFALTGRLLDVLLATPDARVVTVSSTTHRFGRMKFDDLNGEQSYNRWGAYSQSKLANLLFAYELQRKLADTSAAQISVAAHPGYASTNLQGKDSRGISSLFWDGLNKLFAQNQEMGALPQLYAATADTIVGGYYYGPNGFYESRGYPHRVRSNAASYDKDAAGRLWEMSVQFTGVAYDALKQPEGVH